MRPFPFPLLEADAVVVVVVPFPFFEGDSTEVKASEPRLVGVTGGGAPSVLSEGKS